MKTILFLVMVLLLAACANKTTSQRHIEPSDYFIMSYEVKDVAYHDSVASILQDNPHISISGESTFTVTKELGQLVFNGTDFTYKINGDSLILSNDKQRHSYKIQDLSPDFLSIQIDHKFFSRIDLVKPADKRQETKKVVTIKY